MTEGQPLEPRQDGPAKTDAGYRDLQRAALREVIELSAESVEAVEAPIEQAYAAAKAAAEKRFQRTRSRLEQRFRSIEEVARRAHDGLVLQIRALSDSDSSTLEAKTRTLQEQITKEAEGLERELKKQLDHEVWLTESVAEATRNQLANDRKRLKKEIPAKASLLDALEEEAAWLLEAYGQPPPQAQTTEDEPPRSEDPGSALEQAYASAQEHLAALEDLRLPRRLSGLRPYGYGVLLGLLAAAGGVLGTMAMHGPPWPSAVVAGSLAFVAGLAGAVGLGAALRPLARSRVRAAAEPLYRALAAARAALERYSSLEKQRLDEREAEVARKRERETRIAKTQFESSLARIRGRRDLSLERLEQSSAWLREEIAGRREGGLHQAEEEQRRLAPGLHERYEQFRAMMRERHERAMAACEEQHTSARQGLEARWREGLSRIEHVLAETDRLNQDLFREWGDPSWESWSPPTAFASVVRFGTFEVDVNRLAGGVRRLGSSQLQGRGVVSLPALLAFPDRCSLLLQTGRGGQGQEEAIRALQAVMARLLTSLPAGRVRFTIIDPVGLGENFAGFMHLADHMESLVGGRIWTESAHIEQRLTDLTTHMENVIQKYLRNEFETIDAYNEQAGELAEPYRFLVVANFPVNFNEESARRLASIVSSGARCGVYTLIAHDTRQPLPTGIQPEDLTHRNIPVVHDGDRFVWQDEVFRRFPLRLDRPPPEALLTRLMHKVGEGAQVSSRVEVPFETIAPRDDQWWSADSRRDLRVPIGRTGAIRLQHLGLGQGVAQHALIAGKTGSGKSTLLHVIITNLALWYRPDEVELYLVDFKKGVEFKTYATHDLPHARAVAIESDREFGLSVLQRLDAEMARRGDLFRQAGVQDLSAYRQTRGEKLPRTLLIVDEFQMFFSEDDKLAQDAGILLDRLVRQGRAFGIHVLLGSQTLGGTAGLARSTIGQMAVRVALQCSETDSQLILDDDNTAARLLSRPGEAIYNDAGGLVEGNSPFQTAWLPDDQRDAYLDRVGAWARDQGRRREPLIVFEGNTAPDLGKNPSLAGLLSASDWPTRREPPRVWLGEAVAIKEPTTVVFRRQSGANLILVGQREDAALAMLSAAMVGLAAQHAPGSARFVLMDGSPVGSPRAGYLGRVASVLPHATRIVEWREVGDVIGELTGEARRRQEADETEAPAVYVVVYGLQRYRALRRREDDFGLSMDESDRAASPDKAFAELVREGPPLGMHVLAWSDTPIALERTFDRQTLREFDNRVLFQMSAADSSNLIDSPAANKLGFYRALFCSEEQGVLEKFRPYALAEDDWLEQVRRQFEGKSGSVKGEGAG